MSLATIPVEGLTYTLRQLRAFLAQLGSAATPDATLPMAPTLNPSATFRMPISAVRPAVLARIAEIEAELADRQAA